jgi:hypothetical protein
MDLLFLRAIEDDHLEARQARRAAVPKDQLQFFDDVTEILARNGFRKQRQADRHTPQWVVVRAAGDKPIAFSQYGFCWHSSREAYRVMAIPYCHYYEDLPAKEQYIASMRTSR